MLPQEYLIPLVTFTGVAAAAYLVLLSCDPYHRLLKSRIADLTQGTRTTGSAIVGDATSHLPSKLTDTLQQVGLVSSDSRSQLERRLAKAGIYDPSAPFRFLMARVAFCLFGVLFVLAAGFAGIVHMNLAIPCALLAGALGAIIPSLWLDQAIKRHHILLRKSLPDFLDLMTICLEGGLSLQETIRRVSDELMLAHPVFARELGIVQRDIELGATVEQALKRSANRTDYEGLRTLSAFIREAQRFGTNITEALRSHADMLRIQREQAAEENAQKVAVKILLPTLFLIFPAVFVVAVGPAIIQIHEAFSSQDTANVQAQ